MHVPGISVIDLQASASLGSVCLWAACGHYPPQIGGGAAGVLVSAKWLKGVRQIICVPSGGTRDPVTLLSCYS